jgi:hypothetical protein
VQFVDDDTGDRGLRKALVIGKAFQVSICIIVYVNRASFQQDRSSKQAAKCHYSKCIYAFGSVGKTISVKKFGNGIGSSTAIAGKERRMLILGILQLINRN